MNIWNRSFSKNKTSYQKHDGNTELCTVVHSDLRNGDLKARIDNQTRGIDIEKLMKEQVKSYRYFNVEICLYYFLIKDRAQGLDHVPINMEPKIKDGWITKDLFYFCIEYYNYSILLLL